MEVSQGISEYYGENIIGDLCPQLVEHVRSQLGCSLSSLGAYEHNTIGELVFTVNGNYSGYLSDFMIGSAFVGLEDLYQEQHTN